MTGCKQKIKEWYRAFRQRLTAHAERARFRRFLRSGGARKAYIMGAPQYANLGDSAITLAQRCFLRQSGIPDAAIKEITKEEYEKFRGVIRRCVRPGDLITCTGGGNMGDEWLAEEHLRRAVLQDFPDHTVIVFPQTLYYTPTARGRQEEQASVPCYDRPNCVLLARETLSRDMMRRLYPHAQVRLTPDCVLAFTQADFGVQEQERKTVLLALRKDVESALTPADKAQLADCAHSLGLPVQELSMNADAAVTKQNRAEQVRRKMQQFAAARLVVTDRLHGMVFAAITGTPCVVLKSHNHKTEGVYAWLQDLPYIVLAQSVPQAQQAMQELLRMPPCTYDASALQNAFAPLREALHNETA